MKPLCVIPARGGSKRLPRKNIAEIGGKPMVAYAIEAALTSGVFEKVCVSTEDEEIAAVSRASGAEVPFMRRPDLASDTATIVDVSLDVLAFFEEMRIVFLEMGVLLPTCPLRTAEDIQEAYRRFREANAQFLMAVTEYDHSPFRALKKEGVYLDAFWDRKYLSMKAQELPHVLVDNGAVYFVKTEALKKQRIFYGEKLIGYYMPRERSVDVDTIADLKIVRALMGF